MSFTIELYNKDCMEGMKEYPDKHFNLAIVDPPYGLDITNIWGDEKYGYKQYSKKEWDKVIPDKTYFNELQRVSKNQIIWGGNYFANLLNNSSCWLVWNKGQRNFSLSDGELAWVSYNKSIRIFDYSRSLSNFNESHIHPTQKPVALYTWLLKNYATQGDKILDTHLGSGSIAIACYGAEFDLVGFEIDKEYYEAMIKRFEKYKRQQGLFNIADKQIIKQGLIFGMN